MECSSAYQGMQDARASAGSARTRYIASGGLHAAALDRLDAPCMHSRAGAKQALPEQLRHSLRLPIKGSLLGLCAFTT